MLRPIENSTERSIWKNSQQIQLGIQVKTTLAEVSKIHYPIEKMEKQTKVDELNLFYPKRPYPSSFGRRLQSWSPLLNWIWNSWKGIDKYSCQ